MRSIITLILACAIGLTLFSRLSRQPTAQEIKPETPPPAQEIKPEPRASFTEDYESAMKETERKVLLVFGAKWCPHCKELEAHLKEINLDGILVCKVDVDKHRDIARKHSVRLLPVSIMIEKGEEKSRVKGFSKAEFDAWLSANK